MIQKSDNDKKSCTLSGSTEYNIVYEIYHVQWIQHTKPMVYSPAAEPF